MTWTEPTKTIDSAMMLLEFVSGLCVGSFLNVLAVRTLAEQSILSPRSHCPKCKHELAFFELVPVLSWLFLRGRCRYCHERIAWYYPFVEIFTGITFILIGANFGWSWGVSVVNHVDNASVFTCTGFAMAYFACMLITISITDFKEKLIPHDITYPSMLVGIIYSASNPNIGALNALAGAGISYILFDFLAFYGLKVYEHSHKNDHDEDEEDTAEGQDVKQLEIPFENLPALSAVSSTDEATVDGEPKVVLMHGLGTVDKTPEIDEDFEVMGGGDAVLSAVIAVWLGLKALGFVLLTGFMIGTFMGATYLMIEMVKQKVMHKATTAILLCSTGFLVVIEGFLYFLYSLQYPYNPNAPTVNLFFSRMPWFPLGVGAIIAGVILGTVLKGSKYSKPFPFGPALAIAAFVCIFFNPFDIQDAPGVLMNQVRNAPILQR